MTPKKEARDLIEKYNLIVLDTALGGSNTRVKKCALICVNEILKAYYVAGVFSFEKEIDYWNEVKQEIQKL